MLAVSFYTPAGRSNLLRYNVYMKSYIKNLSIWAVLFMPEFAVATSAPPYPINKTFLYLVVQPAFLFSHFSLPVLFVILLILKHRHNKKEGAEIKNLSSLYPGLKKIYLTLLIVFLITSLLLAGSSYIYQRQLEQISFPPV